MTINNESGLKNSAGFNLEKCEENQVSNISWWKIWKKKRHMLTLMMFFGCFNIYALRANLSVAVVAMTQKKSHTLENGTTVFESLLQFQDFDWDSTQIGFLLSSFFWGYITTQFIGGYLAEKFGGKLLLGLAVLSTSILTLLTPIVAKQNYYALICLRIIEGIFEGVSYPSFYSIFARWAPPLERSRISTITYSGNNIGALVSLTLSGVIGEYLGWESIFYVFGSIGVLWYIVWHFWIAESPSEDKYISKSELNYILKSLNKNKEEKRDVKHPWKEIFTSVPFYATSIALFSELWGFNTLLTQLPTFMSDILGFNLSAIGSYSALPYLTTAIFTVIGGFIADWIIEAKFLNKTQVRKLFTCFAFLSQTIFMLAAAFFMSPVCSTIFLTLSIGLGGLCYAGFIVNILELGPSHASVLIGIANTFATIPGMVSSTVTGYIVQNGTTDEWRIVFYIVAALYLFGCIFYGIFASAELQPWSVEYKRLKEVSSTTDLEKQNK